MTTQHTPGKWQANAKHAACDNQAEIVIEQEDGSAPIAKVFQIYGDQMQANARLMAASPDLLEALWAMVTSFHAVEYMEPHMQQSAAMARSAIAKATGGQP